MMPKAKAGNGDLPRLRERFEDSPYRAKDGRAYHREVVNDVPMWRGPEGNLVGALKERVPGVGQELVKPRPEAPLVEEALDFPLGDVEGARWSSRGIDLVRTLEGGGERIARVIAGPVKPLARLDVDGRIHYRWDLGGREVIAPVDALLDRLRAEGRILHRSRAQDVLSAVASGMVRETKVAHATFGVYPEAGLLRICGEPVPVEDEEAKAWEAVALLIGRGATREEVQACVELLPFWHPFEVLPALGLGLAAPFTPVLRAHQVLVPHAFHWAEETDLGKSLVALVVSQGLWGAEPTSGPGLSSPFRLAAHLDSIALPVAVEEAEKVRPELWPTLKDSAERWLADKRGTKELGMVRYASRAVLILSGNSLPITSGPVLKRFLVVRFDSSARLARRPRSAEVDQRFNALRPIGYQLLRWFLEGCSTQTDLLELLGRWEAEIRGVREGWSSAKRPQAWAVVYLGLKILEGGSIKVGLSWRAPGIAQFVLEVVEPVEASTWGLRRSHASRFVSWFALWRVKNTRTLTEEAAAGIVVRGEGEIFRADSVDVGGQEVPGYWVTEPLLDAYNRETRPGEEIPSLTELARQAADEVGLPYSAVLDADGVHARRVKIGGRAMRAAFIPDSLEGSTQKPGNLGTFDEPGGVPIKAKAAWALGTDGPGGPETPQGSQVPKVSPIPLKREEARGPGGFPSMREAILAIRKAASKVGKTFRPEELPEPERRAFLELRSRWLQEGEVYEPSKGSFCFTELGP